MARLFRFVQKKRGGRRTGSNLLGSVGEAAVYAALFLVGTLLLAAVIATQVAHADSGSLGFGRGWWLLILVVGSCVVLGGGGLVWTVLNVGVSAERRSALVRRVSEIDIVHEALPRTRHYPTLPSVEGLTNSPGIELAYRLPPSQTPGWRLFAALIFALLWNLVVFLLTVSAISGHLARQPEWMLTLLVLPMWGVSTWSVRHLLQLLVLQSGMGQTSVEISDLPLVPGREYQVSIAQDGNVTMRSLRLWLICEEEATYLQGTDTRTETREVYRQSCFERRDFSIEPGMPFTAQCSFATPATAMHSFQSGHNVVRWKLVVRGDAEGWPEFERGFSIVVHPGEATMQLEQGKQVARQALLPAPLPIVGAAGARV